MYDQSTIRFAQEQERLLIDLEIRPTDHDDGRAEGRDATMRDYARVLYSSSFRRLQGKMQLLGIDANRLNRNTTADGGTWNLCAAGFTTPPVSLSERLAPTI
jgi:dGTPase